MSYRFLANAIVTIISTKNKKWIQKGDLLKINECMKTSTKLNNARLIKGKTKNIPFSFIWNRISFNTVCCYKLHGTFHFCTVVVFIANANPNRKFFVSRFFDGWLMGWLWLWFVFLFSFDWDGNIISIFVYLVNWCNTRPNQATVLYTYFTWVSLSWFL